MFNEDKEMNKSQHAFKELEFTVDMTESNKMMNRIIDELNQDSPSRVINKIINTPHLWLPQFDVVKRQVEEIYTGKISSIVPHIIYSERHEKPIAVLRGKEIMKYKTSRHYSIWLKMQDIHLKLISDNIIMKKIKPEDFNEFFSRNDLKEHTNFIKKALIHHFNKDFVSSVHILIPRLEGVLRDCIKLSGLDVLYKEKDGSWSEKSVSQLLDQTSGISKIIDPNLTNYLRFFLARKLGDNNRNTVAHALLDESKFNDVFSLRLILLLIIFYNPK